MMLLTSELFILLVIYVNGISANGSLKGKCIHTKKHKRPAPRLTSFTIFSRLTFYTSLHYIQKTEDMQQEIVNGSCTFDHEKCGWRVNGRAKYTWKLQQGNATHTSKGPDRDHTIASKNGKYFYTISQSPSNENDVSDLQSVLIKSNPKLCLTFWYYMYGTHINTLKVFQVKNTSLIELWKKSANQGNKWHFQSLSLDDIGLYKILFRATRGNGYKSEIAVDDIFINNIECKKVNGTSVTSDSTTTGLVVGLVIGGLLLACVVIVIVVLIRRQIFKCRPREKIRNNLGANDYIGVQDIALPLTTIQVSHVQKDANSSNTSVRGFASTHAPAKINNVNKERVQAPAYAVPRNTMLSDTQTLNDDKYSVVDQTAETSFNGTIDDETRTADNYMVLDLAETGFKRKLFSNTPSGYEFVKPVKDTRNKIGDEDQYALSEDGVYDHSGSNRHKELEDNIYNHTVDTIYDSGSHTRNDEGREDTYDHFFGQKTEDDYDISTTT